ncbi:RDD family protein [Schaalia sp. 19OD2882]|uniref:RDD family protein n=1 Tax=Schaalia sp. 19OD2882 TaxID=2794089 RepID=UPI001C1E9A56|nr:RDD family protein [Schaalia sp. 19OD2882]QWW20300.1 RDD family protein [Schaalia sp. 19OD2882]
MSAPVVPVRHITEEKIVTGEAVELEIHPASPVLRIAARLVDTVITIQVGVLLGNILSPLVESLSSSSARIVMISFAVFIMVLMPFLVEVLTRGSSLGKWAFGIHVVRDDGGTVTARHVMVRTLVAVLEIWGTAGGLGLTAMMVSPKGKRLGDLAGGTMVVALPNPVAHPALLMPPDLGAWASSAQILPLPPALHNEALGFMRTNASLRPDVREILARSLAAKVQVRVSPPPPAPTHPERFLAAVLVVLRDREYFRALHRDAVGAQRRVGLDAPQWGI